MNPLNTPADSESLQCLAGWPVFEIRELSHVGHLKSELKRQTHNRMSLEGSGLSVSVNPDAWRAIAKLGDVPVWLLECEQTPLFIDAHQVQAQERQEVTRWGLATGLVSVVDIHRLSWSEDGESKVFESEDLANVQVEMQEVGNYADTAPALTTRQGLAASSLMNARMGFKVCPGLVEDLLLTVYAEDVLYGEQQIQGIWWSDKLDVANYSAPRGVIHRRALNDWQALDPQNPTDVPRNLPGLSGKGQVRCSHVDTDGKTTHSVVMKARIAPGNAQVMICSEPLALQRAGKSESQHVPAGWDPLRDKDPVSKLFFSTVVFEDDQGMSFPVVVLEDGRLVENTSYFEHDFPAVDELLEAPHAP